MYFPGTLFDQMTAGGKPRRVALADIVSGGVSPSIQGEGRGGRAALARELP
jgi:hypothetical protein